MTIPIPPPEEMPLPDPDALTFGEVFALKATTGIDVHSCTGTQQGAVLLFYALKQRDPKVQWSQLLQLTPSAANAHMLELADRLGREQAEAERLRNERANAAAVEQQLEELGEELPALEEPARDPS